MEFSFKAEVVLHLQHNTETKKTNHAGTEFNLEVSENIVKSAYIGEDGLPTIDGSKTLSNVLIQGLVGNIHMAHEKGFRDSAEHLRWIISELEKGFVTVAHVGEGNFTM